MQAKMRYFQVNANGVSKTPSRNPMQHGVFIGRADGINCDTIVKNGTIVAHRATDGSPMDRLRSELIATDLLDAKPDVSNEPDRINGRLRPRHFGRKRPGARSRIAHAKMTTQPKKATGSPIRPVKPENRSPLCPARFL